MGTTVGNKDIVTTGSGHTTMTPPAVSLNPPTPPAGPVPVPYPYTARSATASKTESALEAGGDPVVVKGSVLDVDPPANQPSQPTGGDVVTHAVKGKAKVTEGSSNTKAGGKGVTATGDGTCVNVMTGNEEVAQESHMPLLKAGGADMAGDKDGEGSDKDKKGKRALAAQGAKKCVSDPVDVATGQVVDDDTDLALPGAIPLVWQRSYSSGRARERGALGRGGWVHSFEQWIEREDEVITLRSDDGRAIYFDTIGAGESTFNRAERLTLAADRSGGFTVLEHVTRRTRVFAPLPGAGRAMLRAIRDAYGHAITLEYDGERLARMVDTAGRELRIKNDERGCVVRVEVWATLPAAQTPPSLELWFDYSYGPGGELASATNALGHAERYAYDALHRMVKKTLKNGVSFHYAYDDETGWCVRAWGDGGLLAAELAPDLQNKTTMVSGTHQPQIYSWNDRGLVLRQTTHDRSFVLERAYDEDGYLISEANAAGETTTYEHDARGNRTKVVDPAGNETAWEYVDDRPVKRIGPDGLTTTYEHDARGALVGVRYPSELHYSLAHDPHGRLQAIHGADGPLVTFVYDVHHNLVQDVDARGARTTYVHEALGRPVSRSDALGRQTRVEYDLLRRPVVVHFPDKTSTSTAYEPSGNIARFVDALGRTTEMEYAGTGVLARILQADGQSWLLTYDSDEQLRKIENPRGERYEFEYDRAGRIEREKTFDGRGIAYRYDGAGRLSRIDYPDSTWREFVYDTLGNLVEEHSPDGDIQLERDPLGRLKKAVLAEYGGKIVNVFERDSLGRVIAEKQGERTIRYEYDARGRRASRIMPGGETTRYHYDLLGALTAVDHDGHKIAFERDALGRETRQHVYAGRVDIQSAYDPMDRLVDQRVSAPARSGGAAHAVLSQRRWSYDAVGRLAQTDDARSGTTQYQYDSIGQLIEARNGKLHEVFEYDAAGSLQNVLSALGQVGHVAPWAMKPGNVLTGTSGARYENDERGRRVKKAVLLESDRGEAREEVTAYAWDCRDRLREVTLPDGRRVLFTYDAFARRVRKEVIPPEQADFPSTVRSALEKGKQALPRRHVIEFLWDSDALAADIDTTAGTRVFVHRPASQVPMIQAEQGAAFTYVNDHLGMPKELVDQDGRVAWAARHSAWGQVVETWRDPKATRTVESPFRLLGQYEDSETGLCSTRYRYFDPATARWLTPDPIGLQGGRNLLAFDGSPTSDVDPLGLASKKKCSGGGDDEDPLVYKAGKNDEDWRGTGRTEREAIAEAFRKTGVPIEDFVPTKWAKNIYGKTVPVEWRAPGGAEVNIDYGHPPTTVKLDDGTRIKAQVSPDAPHVGWQGPGKGAPVGHILLDDVMAGRSKGK